MGIIDSLKAGAENLRKAGVAARTNRDIDRATNLIGNAGDPRNNTNLKACIGKTSPGIESLQSLKTVNWASEIVDEGVKQIVGNKLIDGINDSFGSARGASHSLGRDVQNLGVDALKDAFGIETGDAVNFGGPERLQPGKGELECCPSAYAMELADAEPKLNNMFFLEIIYTDEFQQVLRGNENYNGSLFSGWLYLKSCTRPKINFEHEVVNMYNFRTKIPTKGEYDTMTVVAHDDGRNIAMDFLQQYYTGNSPMANLDTSDEYYLKAREAALENNGMDFQNIDSSIAGTMQEGTSLEPQISLTSGGFGESNQLINSAGRNFFSSSAGNLTQSLAKELTDPKGDIGRIGTTVGPTLWEYSSLVGAKGRLATTKTLIQKIRLYHVYSGGKYCDIHTFVNPKVLKFNMDDLEMSTVEANTIEFEFGFDFLHLENKVFLFNPDSRYEQLRARISRISGIQFPVRLIGNASDFAGGIGPMNVITKGTGLFDRGLEIAKEYTGNVILNKARDLGLSGQAAGVLRTGARGLIGGLKEGDVQNAASNYLAKRRAAADAILAGRN